VEKRLESLTTSAPVAKLEQKQEKSMTLETVTLPQTQNTPSEPITKPKKKKYYPPKQKSQSQVKPDSSKTQTSKKPRNTKRSKSGSQGNT
jgi:hypothetical protein